MLRQPRARLASARCCGRSRATRRCSCSSSLADSDKDAPNENYARELMELFTLGGRLHRARRPRGRPRADRLARATWRDGGRRHLRFDPERHDGGVKRIFGHTRPLRPARRARLVRRPPAPRAVPRRASCGTSSSTSRWTGARGARSRAPTAARATGSSRSSARSSTTRALYAHLDAPDMVKCAGRLRRRRAARGAAGRSTIDDWTWLLGGMGQRRSARRRSRAGTGARRGCRPTACAMRFDVANDLLGWDDARR